MNRTLNDWFDVYRDRLLPRWTALLHGSSNGIDALPDDGAVLTISNGVLIAEQLYTGISAAADGDLSPLDAYLRSLVSGDNGQEPNLEKLLEATAQLRRGTRLFLHETSTSAEETLALVDGLDEIFEHTVSVLARSWSERAAGLIREREFIAESLDSASAAADQRALQLKALNDISQQLSASLEEDQLIDLVVSSLYRLTEVAHIAVWQPTNNRKALIAVQTQGDEHEPVVAMRISCDAVDDLIVRTFQRGQVQFELAPPPELQGAWLQPMCGVLALPMLIDNQSLAVVSLQDPNPIEQLRYQQDLALGVINQAAIALQNARLYTEVRTLNADLERRVEERTRELQEEKDRLASTHQISIEVGQSLDLGQILNSSLEILAQITRADHASVMLIEQDDSSLMVTRAVLGVPANPGNYTRFPIGAGIAGWVAQHRKSALVDDVSSDDRWATFPGSSLRRREGAMISVPLLVQGEVLGVLTLSHPTPYFFNEGHLRLLNACAGAIAIGVNNANLFSMISREAERRYELLDRQQSEATQIEAILQSLSDGVIVCDLYGGVLTTNPAAAQMLERNVEDVLLWNLNDILTRYLGTKVHELPLDELLARPLNHQGDPRSFSTIVKVGVRVINMRMGPVMKENGELIGALVVLRDVTREIEADRLKTEFIGTMSHELRTPMTAIKGFTQLLAMGGLGPLNETQREFVNTIYSNTERMIALINDVLDITKIESGSVDLEWRSLHMAEALSGVVAELQQVVGDRNHQLNISIPPGLPLVRADANRLHQILYNVLSNAVKYTPRGGEIHVEAFEANTAEFPESVRDRLAVDRRYMQMVVRDTGVGISKEDLPRIFDRFYRTENPLKIEAGGTGLGLSLVKPLVELLGGRIWVESSPGEGSRFTIVLPAA